ncbi:TPA: hypothetical protein ACID2X_005189 [Pseudomonas aeruginosa]
MQTLMQRYTEYNDRLKAQGVRFLASACPKCGGEIETERATRGQTWDTLSTCPHCEALFMKITTHTKAVGRIPAGVIEHNI